MSLPVARRRAPWGPLLVVLAATGFSFKAIFIKLLYAEFPVDAETLLALRMLFALPFFLVMALLSRDATRQLERRDWILLIAMGFIGYYLCSYLDFIGLQYISAGLERLILFLQPTMVVLLSALFFGTPIRRRHAISLVLSYTGIARIRQQPDNRTRPARDPARRRTRVAECLVLRALHDRQRAGYSSCRRRAFHRLRVERRMRLCDQPVLRGTRRRCARPTCQGVLAVSRDGRDFDGDAYMVDGRGHQAHRREPGSYDFRDRPGADHILRLAYSQRSYDRGAANGCGPRASRRAAREHQNQAIVVA